MMTIVYVKCLCCYFAVNFSVLALRHRAWGLDVIINAFDSGNETYQKIKILQSYFSYCSLSICFLINVEEHFRE